MEVEPKVIFLAMGRFDKLEFTCLTNSFVCLGCQTNHGSPTPCPGYLCLLGQCNKHNEKHNEGESCRPNEPCKTLGTKLKYAGKESREIGKRIFCGKKEGKCMQCFKLPFVEKLIESEKETIESNKKRAKEEEERKKREDEKNQKNK